MNNRRSYLDQMNAGRHRRPTTSLEQLNETLNELEQRIRRPLETADDDDRANMPIFRARERDTRYAAPQQETRAERWPEPRRDNRMVDELQALREEVRTQMSTGLRHEFASLRQEIDQALKTSGGSRHAAELGAEFERLATMIHRLAERSDDRQINMLRGEVEEVKGALGKLAREETLQTFDRRWDEFDRRWNDMAAQVSDTQRNRIDGDRTLEALSQRLEQIAESVNSLPSSLVLRSLEDKMKILASTVDQFAHQQDRIGPEALDAIEERLDEISRAVVASTAAAHPASFDPAPFERIEARISSLARQLGEVIEDNPTSALVGQLAELGNRVESIARRVDVPEDTVSRLASQIDIISRKLDDAPARPDLDAVFDGLERRFARLSSMLEQRHEDALAQGQSLFRDLERRLDEVSTRMSDRDAYAPASLTSPSDDFLQAMDDRFAELASRLERQHVAAQPAPSVDPDLIRSLEAQIAGLAAHISQPVSVPELEQLSPRLDKIEQSIADNRMMVVEAARMAAEEAVRSIAPSKAEDSAVVASLTEDLKTLETLSRKSDERNTKTFEAIHDTLLKIVDRLGSLEAEQVDAPYREKVRNTLPETPSFVPAEEELPLETMLSAPRLDNQLDPRVAEEALDDAIATVRAEAAASGDTVARRSMLGGITKALTGRMGKKDAEANAPVSMPQISELQFSAPDVEAELALDPQLANQPLEPGSGAPDLNAIMKRVRGERGQPIQGTDVEASKADFIAAARRAAQAAAAEAETSKRGPGDAGSKEGFNVSRLFAKSKKPLLMGAAILAISVLGMQASKTMLGGNNETSELTEIAPSEIAPQESEIVSEAPSVVEEAPAAPVRVAGNPEPIAVAPDAEAPVADWKPATTEDGTAWLDPTISSALPTPEAAAEAPATAPVVEDAPAVEIAALPNLEDALSAIPVTAGPIALREAAAGGDPKALFEIANRYAEGRGVPADMVEAAKWYEKAAEEGLAPAQYRIGNLYEKGLGVTRDMAKAKTWYQLAAGQGNATAMHNLAVLFAMGADGVTDNESAARWFQNASELGVRDSQFNLGILTAKGVGTKQDLGESYKWFDLLAKAGDKDAADKRDEVAKVMTPQALERAKAASELWQAKPLDVETNHVEIPDSWSESAETTASVDMKQVLRNIQELLNAGGYDAGTPDGVMGQKTKNAISAFQKSNGMKPTGAVDEAFVKALLASRQG